MAVTVNSILKDKRNSARTEGCFLAKIKEWEQSFLRSTRGMGGLSKML